MKLKMILLIMIMINILLLQSILTAEKNAARLTQSNLSSKSDIANFVKKTDFNDKLNKFNKNVTSNKTKPVLVENELNELSKKV